MDKKSQKRKRGPDGDAVNVEAGGNGGGFASAMSKIMSRDLSNKATPVLAKRKTAQAKQADKFAAATKDESKKRKARKRARKAHLAVPDPLQADFERGLRKVATKGVVALFNAIAKHQRAIEDATEDINRTGQKAKVVASQNKSFLDLLKGSRQGASDSVAAAGGGGKAQAAGGKPAFLHDNFLQKSAKGKGKALEREVEEEEEGGWMDDGDGGY